MPEVSFIPKSYQEGFKKIDLMSEMDFQSIKDALSIMSLVGSRRHLAAKISIEKGIKENILREIFSSIGSLVSLLEIEEDVFAIADSITKVAISESVINEVDGLKFKDRVLFLLQNPHIFYASKAQDLTSEYPNVFIDSKIATDVRPVFGVKIEDSPKCGLVIHNLHIHFRAHQEGEHKDFYIALDSDDVQTLIETLERAKSKEVSLKGLFNKANLINLKD